MPKVHHLFYLHRMVVIDVANILVSVTDMVRSQYYQKVGTALLIFSCCKFIQKLCICICNPSYWFCINYVNENDLGLYIYTLHQLMGVTILTPNISTSRSGMQYIFTCILPAGSRILSVRTFAGAVLDVRSSMSRDGTSAGNDMDREPGIYRGRQAWYPWWCVWHHRVRQAYHQGRQAWHPWWCVWHHRDQLQVIRRGLSADCIPAQKFGWNPRLGRRRAPLTERDGAARVLQGGMSRSTCHWFSGPEINASWRPRVNWACAVVKIATWTDRLGWRTDKHYSSSTHWPEQGGGIREYHRSKRSHR